MNDPYRDELLALRVENERLRRRLEARARPRGRRAALAGAVLGGSSVAAFASLIPLLNAPSDARFTIGVLATIAIAILDVVALIALARWATPPADGE
jgi:hypothetical protein